MKNEDVEFDRDEELDDSVVVEEHQGDQIKKLKEKLKLATEEKQKLFTDLQKAKADFVNLRKKDEEEKMAFAKFAKETVVLDIIPVLDSFDLAFKNKEVWESLPKDWRVGVESIQAQLWSIMSQHGVEKIAKIGEKFDPKNEEAVETVEVSDREKDGEIVEVITAGYSLNGKLIRPARVKVGEFKK